MNIDTTLHLFCADEEVGPALSKPFEQGDCICATDIHALFRVPKTMTSDTYDKATKPEVSRIIPKSDPQFTLAFEDLFKAFEVCGIDPETAYIECDECNNNNEVEWQYTDLNGNVWERSFECPVCRGTGRVRNGQGQTLQLGKEIFAAEYLLLLLFAMTATGTDTATVTLGNCHIHLFDLKNGTQVMLMPCLYKEKEYPTLKIKTNPYAPTTA